MDWFSIYISKDNKPLPSHNYIKWGEKEIPESSGKNNMKHICDSLKTILSILINVFIMKL